MNITRFEPELGLVSITLSRRNLLSLLAKLDGHPPDSHCMLSRQTDLAYLTIVAEEDEAHYQERDPGPLDQQTVQAVYARQKIRQQEISC